MESKFELSLLEPEEREEVNFIWQLLPKEDRKGMEPSDVVFVLDAMDDYLESIGLMESDATTGEVLYKDGEVDETEQLQYVLDAVREGAQSSPSPLCSPLTSAQVQLIMDGEMQYGLQQGWYEEED